jgi:hypothetical protein
MRDERALFAPTQIPHTWLTSESLLSNERLLDARRYQVLDVSLAGDQLIHSLFRDPGPNWLVIDVPGLSGSSGATEICFPSLRLCTSISQHESQPQNPLYLYRILGDLPLPPIGLFGIALKFAVDQRHRESLP